MITFENQGLSPEILRAVSEQGFIHLTPIQEKVIPAILDQPRDIIGLAQTGTGKTAGFGLPIIQQVDLDSKFVQAIILCPTRELCLQITNDLTQYAKYIDKLTILAVYGGSSIGEQIRDLRRGAQIIVGTPGRTLDLINRKALIIRSIRWLVLDEADEMLNMGFREELDAILETTPAEKQVLLFSATMPSGVRQIAENYMNHPLEILAGKKNSIAENVVHHVYHVKNINRFQALKRLIDTNREMYGIVFCRTRSETRDLADRLIQEGYSADALHGDLSQTQRDQVMMRFRKKRLQLLIATDVAARGIDVNDLTHVINYSLPDDPEVYIHRSGRTGRAGKSGVSIALAHVHDSIPIRQIEKLTGKKFENKRVPNGQEICEMKLEEMIDKFVHGTTDDKRIEKFLPSVYRKLEGLEREEIIKRFVSLGFSEFLDSYQESEDINLMAGSGQTGKRYPAGENFARYHINLGRKQNINPNRLMGILNEFMGNKRFTIGKIEIFSNFSFFETERENESMLYHALNHATFEGINLKVQPSKPPMNENPASRRSLKNRDGGFRNKNKFNRNRNNKNHRQSA